MKDFLNLPMSVEKGHMENTLSQNLVPVTLKVVHSGLVRKGFIFTDEGIEDASETMKNIPIVAEVVGEDFNGHGRTISTNHRGEETWDFKTRAIGIVPETNNYRLEEDKWGRKYAVVDGYIWKEYAQRELAVLEDRDFTTSLSMEIAIKKMRLVNNKHFLIEDYDYLGICLLGEDKTPAIEGAGMTVKFSLEEIQDDLVRLKEELKMAKKTVADFSEETTAAVEPTLEASPATESEITEPVVEEVIEEVEIQVAAEENVGDSPEVVFSTTEVETATDEKIDDSNSKIGDEIETTVVEDTKTFTYEGEAYEFSLESFERLIYLLEEKGRIYEKVERELLNFKRSAAKEELKAIWSEFPDLADNEEALNLKAQLEEDFEKSSYFELEGIRDKFYLIRGKSVAVNKDNPTGNSTHFSIAAIPSSEKNGMKKSTRTYEDWFTKKGGK